MPRKPRIEIDGFYHIINRGVEQRVVFEDKEDYEYFEELMCFYVQAHNITIHNYCLMSNHYHLLIEVKGETLSKYMRQLNMNYAIYFNKKHHRSGHLWQGRFKSWYVTDEAYLYTLILYIENNPVKAGIVTVPEAYPYSSANYLLAHEMPECLQNSWVAQNFAHESKESIRKFLHSQPDSDQLNEMKKAASLVEAPNTEKKRSEEKLRSILQKARDKRERNALILQCYEQGYSQHMIAKVLEISQPAVNGIIRRGKKSVIVIT